MISDVEMYSKKWTVFVSLAFWWCRVCGQGDRVGEAKSQRLGSVVEVAAEELGEKEPYGE